MSPYRVTRDFEQALCEYTGARYAVAVNSCSSALMLAVKWHIAPGAKVYVNIPRRTYVSVPQQIIIAGGIPTFRDENWRGTYQLKPLFVWDSARRFTGGMYKSDQFQCISFSSSKILGIEQGGAILHDDDGADNWFRRMRFDGRTEGVDPHADRFDLVGHHCIMLPSIAAQALLKLHHLPKQNADMPEYDYPDLSVHPAFA